MVEFHDQDNRDSLREFRDHFHFPKAPNGEPCVYMCGHSLGLLSKDSELEVKKQLQRWQELAVRGHFEGEPSWSNFHDSITPLLVPLLGAKVEEIAIMNSLTVNLHLALSRFYKPTKTRFKILIEKNAFPSDWHALSSYLEVVGISPKEAIVEMESDQGHLVSDEAWASKIESLGEALSLVWVGNCNYLTGQKFPIKPIVEAAHRVGAHAGFDLAHGVGNIELNLHRDQVDFAVWCHYKYLNAGPGGVGGLFVHERHLGEDSAATRLKGWWGNRIETRFLMKPEFDGEPHARSWQISTPPALLLAALKGSLEIFAQAGFDRVLKKSDALNSYFEQALEEFGLREKLQWLTPRDQVRRGCTLSLTCKSKPAKQVQSELQAIGIVSDAREPNVVRFGLMPLYNSFEDVHRLARALSRILA